MAATAPASNLAELVVSGKTRFVDDGPAGWMDLVSAGSGTAAICAFGGKNAVGDSTMI
jgi:hypothetical protein